MRPSRLLLAAGILLLGLLAALPFRRSSPPTPTVRERAAPLSLTLRRPDAPLELAPGIDVSPATGLGGESGHETGDRRLLLSQAPSDLSKLVSPPALPVSFEPTAPGPQSSDWRPEPLLRMPRPKAQPRAYRLRDGDTLEKIADRLLGNATRAAEIFELNRSVLTRPDLLPVGVTIMLPPLDSDDDLEPVRTQP